MDVGIALSIMGVLVSVGFGVVGTILGIAGLV
jgi:hypothetical protein